MFKLKDIKANKGATLDKQGKELHYTSGYQVSKCDLEVIPLYTLTKKHLIEMLNKIPNGANLGIWIDNNKVYIDQSARISNKRLALKIGRELNQIAIWDWKASESIAC